MAEASSAGSLWSGGKWDDGCTASRVRDQASVRESSGLDNPLPLSDVVAPSSDHLIPLMCTSCWLIYISETECRSWSCLTFWQCHKACVSSDWIHNPTGVMKTFFPCRCWYMMAHADIHMYSFLVFTEICFYLPFFWGGALFICVSLADHSSAIILTSIWMIQWV